MKNYYNCLLVFLFGIVFILNSCKEECPCDDPTDPMCDNYDPCLGKDTINTFFKVRPGDNGFPPPEDWCDLMACDTFNASSVRFDIPEGNPDNSIYEWQIGSESVTRKGQGFEVDFSDYLRDNGWETWIPITLTVRTPMNECLRNEDETVKRVNRRLFFTEKRLQLFEEGKNIAAFKGSFNDKPNEQTIIQYIRITEGSFRGEQAPLTVVVGVPFTDTLGYPRICKNDYCNNYLHTKTVIYQDLNFCYEETKYPLSEIDFQFLHSENNIKVSWFQNEADFKKRHIFRGERL